jgi:uncharacterized membrane protein YGL010W
MPSWQIPAVSCQRQTEQSVTDSRYAQSVMNPPAKHWLAIYDSDHANAANRLIHWICAPVFLAGLLGLLWHLPMPATPATSLAAINWATLFAMASVVYYFIMSISLAIGGLVFLAGVLVAIAWLDVNGAPLLLISSLALFGAAVGQFIGHRLESGGSLSKDILYCVIAPIWVLAALYRKLGIPY